MPGSYPRQNHRVRAGLAGHVAWRRDAGRADALATIPIRRAAMPEYRGLR